MALSCQKRLSFRLLGLTVTPSMDGKPYNTVHCQGCFKESGLPSWGPAFPYSLIHRLSLQIYHSVMYGVRIPDFYHPGHLPSRTFTTMHTNTIPDIYHPPGCLPSRTFTIPDIYHPPGHLPSTRMFTIPGIYHPGHLPSRAFTIPGIYHPGHLPSRAFTIPGIYHPGYLPSRTFTIPCSGSNYPGHLSRGKLSGHHLKVICLASDNSDKYLYNQVDTSGEICIGSFNKFPLSLFRTAFFELKLVL